MHKFPIGARVTWHSNLKYKSTWVGVITAHAGPRKYEVDNGSTISEGMLEMVDEDPAARPYAHLSREDIELALQRRAAEVAKLQQEVAELQALVVAQCEVIANAG